MLSITESCLDWSLESCILSGGKRIPKGSVEGCNPNSTSYCLLKSYNVPCSKITSQSFKIILYRITSKDTPSLNERSGSHYVLHQGQFQIFTTTWFQCIENRSKNASV